MQRTLKLEGHATGKQGVARLMRANGVFARRRRTFRATTDSKHAHSLADKVRDREFAADTPD
jgi:transposase InsO family protein